MHLSISNCGKKVFFSSKDHLFLILCFTNLKGTLVNKEVTLKTTKWSAGTDLEVIISLKLYEFLICVKRVCKDFLK